jgi:Holliday junction resolvase RusA-like endonuclease
MISFFLSIVPSKATSQGAGKRMSVINGRPMFFKNKKAAGAEKDLTVLCSEHAPSQPLQGPITLHVDFCFPWRTSEPLKRRRLGRVPMTKKPDCSNLIKQIEDVMTKLRFWEDDGQVVDLRVTKGWGDRVGIAVRVEPFDSTLAPVPTQAVLL